MSRFEDPDDPAKAQLDADELFVEEDTVRNTALYETIGQIIGSDAGLRVQ
jgi:hypothetical protein